MKTTIECPICEKVMEGIIAEVQTDTDLEPWIVGYKCECGLELGVVA